MSAPACSWCGRPLFGPHDHWPQDSETPTLTATEVMEIARAFGVIPYMEIIPSWWMAL